MADAFPTQSLKDVFEQLLEIVYRGFDLEETY